MIKPTIGRKVWFWESMPETPTQQPEDATVVYVWNDRMVNLRVTNHQGESRALTSVPLLQDDDLRPAGYFAEWMPYQIGQAKKDAAS